jgi:hypothetical protein
MNMKKLLKYSLHYRNEHNINYEEVDILDRTSFIGNNKWEVKWVLGK